jgi:hypothetical protein
MNKEQLAKILLNLLSKQTFKDWYDDEFEDYIQGNEEALTEKQILNDLEWMISRELK